MLIALKWFTPIALIALILVAWGLSFWVSSATSQTLTPTAAVLAELPDEPSPVDFIATVQARLGVLLTREDVATWHALKTRGHAPEEALYIVLSYRQAQKVTR